MPPSIITAIVPFIINQISTIHISFLELDENGCRTNEVKKLANKKVKVQPPQNSLSYSYSSIKIIKSMKKPRIVKARTNLLDLVRYPKKNVFANLFIILKYKTYSHKLTYTPIKFIPIEFSY